MAGFELLTRALALAQLIEFIEQFQRKRRPRPVQQGFGQVLEAESISAGLDYPGVGPEHAHLADIGRARYESVTDDEVIDAFQLMSRTEGIIPALEPAHALAWMSRARQELAGKTVLLNLSGRGDKDVAQMQDVLATRSGR